MSYAQKKGIDVVVVDHHIPEEELPQAVAIVNPNREDDKSGLGHLCAAGVSFFVLAALQKKQDPLSKRINLLSLLDLVALGTVCDVVPLKGINKAFVSTRASYYGERTQSWYPNPF
ncbi:MAG: hypothetical protein H6925_05995 [Holosporaceae bacterium]|nr:MAG: hypothetical protein H6925_05995 [Holosporaceae bacterium]